MAVTAAASGNVTDSSTQLFQGAVVNYLQSLGAQQVKLIADALGSESARAALQGLLACGGAAAQGQSCGAGAAGAAASVVLNNLIDPTEGGDISTLTPQERQARTNIVASLVAGVSTAVGGDAAIVATAAQIETENNALSFIKGTTPRVKVVSATVADILGKPKGQVTRQELDAELAKVRATYASGDLSLQETLNLNSLGLAVLTRGYNEGLISQQEVTATKEYFRAAIVSMAFSGGGNTSVKSLGSATGPQLPSTTGSRTAFRTSTGEADLASIPGLKKQINQKNLDSIATIDPRLAAAAKGSGTSNPNFPIGTGTEAEANRLGQAWVGDGARLSKNQNECPGCIVSADGTRIYRPPSVKPNTPAEFNPTGVQANFEKLSNGKRISNGHLVVTP